MATFNDIVTREDAGPLMMPEEVATEVFQAAQEASVVGRLARRLPNMSAATRRLPVLSVLPNVYFVGEKGRTPQTFGARKPTTDAAWENKYLNAEEMACIVVIPENVLDDEEFDVWAQIQPLISEAIAAKIDQSMLFGTTNVDVPVSWPSGIFVSMPASHQIPLGSLGDLYDDIMGEGGVLNQVELDGYEVNGHVAALGMKAKLRGLRDGGTGFPIFVQDMRAKTPYTLDGAQLEFPKNGAFDPDAALLISGDWDQAVWAVRRDVNFKIVTEGVITNDATPPVIQHNLLQEDLVGLRVTFRMAWQLPNPVNRVNGDDATRFPFAALTPAEPSA